MSQKLNIEIEQGATFTKTITILDSDGSEFEVSGWTGTGQVRKHWTSNTAYDFDITLSDGELYFTMNATTTANISHGLYVYDIQITNNVDGTVKRVLSGMVTVSPEVTR